MAGTTSGPLAPLTPDQQAWAEPSERLWQRAHRIATEAGVDAGDAYHALRCLDLTPAERLRQGLGRGRFRAYARGRAEEHRYTHLETAVSPPATS